VLVYCTIVPFSKPVSQLIKDGIERGLLLIQDGGRCLLQLRAYNIVELNRKSIERGILLIQDGGRYLLQLNNW
jgi:hypothetical protein